MIYYRPSLLTAIYCWERITLRKHISNSSNTINKAIPDGSVSNIHSWIHLVILQSLGDTTFFSKEPYRLTHRAYKCLQVPPFNLTVNVGNDNKSYIPMLKLDRVMLYLSLLAIRRLVFVPSESIPKQLVHHWTHVIWRQTSPWCPLSACPACLH